MHVVLQIMSLVTLTNTNFGNMHAVASNPCRWCWRTPHSPPVDDCFSCHYYYKCHGKVWGPDQAPILSATLIVPHPPSHHSHKPHIGKFITQPPLYLKAAKPQLFKPVRDRSPNPTGSLRARCHCMHVMLNSYVLPLSFRSRWRFGEKGIQTCWWYYHRCHAGSAIGWAETFMGAVSIDLRPWSEATDQL
jgi:hypothetical protein